VPSISSQNPIKSNFMVILVAVFPSGPIGPACRWPLQVQVPTNHFSTFISSGGWGGPCGAGLSSASAANADSAAIQISLFMARSLPLNTDYFSTSFW